MKTKLAIIASTCLVLFAGAAYAADTSVPGGTMSTPGSEAKGNPIPPPDKANNSGQAKIGQNSAAATTPGEESKGKPVVQQ